MFFYREIVNLVYFIGLLRIYNISAQNCLRQANTGSPLPALQDDNNAGLEDGNNAQVIVTSYQFYCCGTITQWQTYVQPGGGMHEEGVYSISFQVWRPSSTVGSDGAGEYSLVGENRFLNINFDENEPITLTPSFDDKISVERDDVVGFFLTTGSSTDRNRDDGIQLAPNYRNTRLLWYQTNAPRPPPSILRAGNGGTLTRSDNAGPMISVSVAEGPCPTTMPPPTTRTTTATPTTPPTIPNGQIQDPTGEVGGTAAMAESNSQPPDGTAIIQSNSAELGLRAGLPILILVLLMIPATISIIIFLWKSHTRKKEQKNAQIADTLYTNSLYSRGSFFQRKRRPSEAPLNTLSPPCSPSSPTSETAFIQPSDSHDHTVTISSEHNPPSSEAVPIPASRTLQKITDMDNIDYDHLEIAGRQRNLSEADYESGIEIVYDNDTQLGPDLPFASAGEIVPSQRDRGILTEEEKKPMRYNKLEFFTNEHTYWTPGATTSEIYDQLSSRNYREIPRKQIKILDHLGSGQFGSVNKGRWKVSKYVLVTAIKQVANDADPVKLLQEAAIMGQFNHPNVVRLYGLVTISQPILVCMEYMENGDLKTYIENLDFSQETVGPFKDVRYFFLRASSEIAAGMRYLSEKSFIHRDLAARNILLNSALACKIGDFGMARDLTNSTYYTAKEGAKIPVKWTAPEAILFKKYSSDSDVWSYGMVLFEIWSVGKHPFSTMSNMETVGALQERYCQPPPPGCPRAIYKLMVDCWNPQHNLRPKFSEVCNYLQQPAPKLLYWSPRDSELGPCVDVLGTPLESASKLYSDLQKHYTNHCKYLL